VSWWGCGLPLGLLCSNVARGTQGLCWTCFLPAGAGVGPVLLRKCLRAGMRTCWLACVGMWKDMLTSTLERHGDLVRRDRWQWQDTSRGAARYGRGVGSGNRCGGQANRLPPPGVLRLFLWNFLRWGRRPIGGTCGRCLCLRLRKLQNASSEPFSGLVDICQFGSSIMTFPEGSEAHLITTPATW